MKIFIGTFDLAISDNPFVVMLMGAVCEQHPDIEFYYDRELFWKKDDWDVVHIMWPDAFEADLQEGRDLRHRLHELKLLGVTIIAHIHNLKPHVSDEIVQIAYTAVYSEAEIMIHLGTYSKELLEAQFPDKKHVIVPHHIYNPLYDNKPSKKEALDYFHYKEGTYVLSFGDVRSDEERDLLVAVARAFPKIKFIVPRFLFIPHGRITKRWLRHRIKRVWYYLQAPNIISRGVNYIGENELPLYYALSDISFIQRVNTLNSGNLPLGMYLGHVIVGPNVGNVGRVLAETRNYSFDPKDKKSIVSAMESALKAVQAGKGEENRTMVKKQWTKEIIGEQLYKIYSATNQE